MLFELHVWGPAFGLPSIDPECLSAIAYLNCVLSNDQWVLVADHDLSHTPYQEFPALYDGSTWVAGYSDIVLHLSKHPSGAYVLDNHIPAQRTPDSTAFYSLLQSTARPLLDLYLYTSYENYSNATAPAYTAILPWYRNYIIPPAHREAARQRTAHLGLSQLEVDNSGIDNPGTGSGGLSGEFEAAKKASGLPSESQSGRPSILRLGRSRGLLSSPVYAARFKLDALANEVFEPFADLLGDKDYILSHDVPSSLDCIAFGYLALMLYPSVPQTWLQEALQSRYPVLVKYIQRMREQLIAGEVVTAESLWSLSSEGDGAGVDASPRKLGLRLPWRPARRKSPLAAIAGASKDIISTLPLLSAVVDDSRKRSPIPPSGDSSVRSSLPSSFLLNAIRGVSATLLSSLVAMAIYHHRSPRTENLTFEASRPHPALRDVGTASDILSVLAGEVRAENEMRSHWYNQGGVAAVGEEASNGTFAVVDVEVGDAHNR